jgi:hypothetical protein
MCGVGEQPYAAGSTVVEAWDEAVCLRIYDAMAGDPLATDVQHRVKATYLAYFHYATQKR